MDEMTPRQRQALLRYLSGEDIEEIARDIQENKVSEIKRWLYDLDTRARLALDREVKLDLICKMEKHSTRLLEDIGKSLDPHNTRNLTVAFGVLQDKIQRAREEIQKIESQIITTKRIKPKNSIKVRADYE